jgi:hypothetical protein
MCFGILPYVILSSWILLQNRFQNSVLFHFIQLVYRLCVPSPVLFCTDFFLIFILSIFQSDGDVVMFSYLSLILARVCII